MIVFSVPLYAGKGVQTTYHMHLYLQEPYGNNVTFFEGNILFGYIEYIYSRSKILIPIQQMKMICKQTTPFHILYFDQFKRFRKGVKVLHTVEELSIYI